MSTKIHSETELYRVESRPASKLLWNEPIDGVATRLWRVPPAQRRERRPIGPWLQLNDLRGVNILARANFAEQLFARCGVEIQHCERSAAGLIAAQRHRGDVHAVVAEQCTDASHHSGAIGVFQHKHHAMRSGFNRPLVDADDSRRR